MGDGYKATIAEHLASSVQSASLIQAMRLTRPLSFSRKLPRPSHLISQTAKLIGILLIFSCSLSTMPICEALQIAIISGSTRTSGPPNPILGPRVVKFIATALGKWGHGVALVNPIEFPLLDKPHFLYAKSQVPPFLQETHHILHQADAYVCVTPEYNHAPSPALVNVLNHFGSSTFSFKPSAIVSYSAGQWGGTRAAIGLRPILGELGCLPVSAMIHIAKAQDVLQEDGLPWDEEDWENYCERCFAQLEWWGDAARTHRSKVDPFEKSPAFRRNPSERDAPQKK